MKLRTFYKLLEDLHDDTWVLRSDGTLENDNLNCPFLAVHDKIGERAFTLPAPIRHSIFHAADNDVRHNKKVRRRLVEICRPRVEL